MTVDRVRTPRAMWLLALAVAVVGVVLIALNAFHVQTRGQNEELGALLVVLAVGLAAVGVAVRGVRRPGLDGVLALAGIVLAAGLFVAWIAVMATSPGDHAGHGSSRTLIIERMPEVPPNAPVLSEDDLAPYPEVREVLQDPTLGDQRHATMPTEKHRAFMALLDAKGAPRTDDGQVAVVDGVAFEFLHVFATA